MNDTSLERRLRDELREHAERATASPDAWERIRERTARRSWQGRSLAMVAVAATVAGAAVVLPDLLARDDGLPELAIEQVPGNDATSSDADGAAGADDGGVEDATVGDAGDDDAGDDDAGGEAARIEGQVDDPHVWRRVDLPETVAAPATYSGMQDVAATGELVVAVGYADDDADRMPVAWRSADGGRSWEVATIDRAQAAEALAVTITGEGDLLAVGGGSRAGVWRSGDGTRWTDVGPDEPVVLRDVLVDPDGRVVAVGEATDTRRSGRVLVSDDSGETWTTARAADGSFDAGGETVLYHVATDGERYVAVGYGPSDNIHDVWVSEDAETWSLVPAGETWLAGAQVIDVLTAHPDGGFLAIEAGGAVRRSADGRSWAAVGSLPHPDEAAGDEAGTVRVGGLARVDTGWLATGTVETPSGRRFAAWASPDGEAWTSAGTDERVSDAIVQGIAATAEGAAVAVAEGVACVDCDAIATAAVWRGAASPVGSGTDGRD